MNGRKKSHKMQIYIRFAEIFEKGSKCNVKMHHMESIFDSLVGMYPNDEWGRPKITRSLEQ